MNRHIFNAMKIMNNIKEEKEKREKEKRKTCCICFHEGRTLYTLVTLAQNTSLMQNSSVYVNRTLTDRKTRFEYKFEGMDASRTRYHLLYTPF